MRYLIFSRLYTQASYALYIQAKRCQGIKNDALVATFRVQKHVHVK